MDALLHLAQVYGPAAIAATVVLFASIVPLFFLILGFQDEPFIPPFDLFVALTVAAMPVVAAAGAAVLVGPSPSLGEVARGSVSAALGVVAFAWMLLPTLERPSRSRREGLYASLVPASVGIGTGLVSSTILGPADDARTLGGMLVIVVGTAWYFRLRRRRHERKR